MELGLCPCDACCGRLEPPTNACLKVFVSGVCSHPFNRPDYMHVCGLAEGTHKQHCCRCGKVWTDAGLTDKQYGEIAYTKAVE